MGTIRCLGLPETGNPALGEHHYVSSESEARDLLQGFEAQPDLTAWFTARENLLYKYSPRLEKKNLLLKHLSQVRSVVAASDLHSSTT